MSWAVMIPGFLLGAAGSLHCIGMCGPLSLALPVHHLSRQRKFISLLLYQLGRIITYAGIGLLFGLAGRRIYIAGYQQYFSIIAGTVITGFAVLYFFGQRSIRFKPLNRFYLFVQQQIAKLLRSGTNNSGLLLLGMANGLLPCGMVYIAVAVTFSFTDVSDSVSFMAMFGTGTLPAMMLVGYAGQMTGLRRRISIQKMIPVFISVMGILLVLRGLNLGIPFISPLLPAAPGSTVVCHP